MATFRAAAALLLVALIECQALYYDPAATTDLEDAVDADALVMVVKHTKPRKVSGPLPESLFEIKFPGELQRFSLKLNRHKKTVSLEGPWGAVSWTDNSFDDGGSVALEIKQHGKEGSKVTLYKGCERHSELHMPTSIKEIYYDMLDPKIKLMREKRFPVHVYAGTAADVLGCKEAKDRKDDVMLGDQPAFTNNELPYRGDIPVNFENCDDLLMRSVDELIKLVKMLRTEVIRQGEEIRHLRGVLENCAGCKEQEQRVDCRSNPCYPG